MDIDVHEEVILEIMQTNIMLSSEYKNWQVARINRGEFMDEYSNIYDILPFRFFYYMLEREGMTASGAGLPELTFQALYHDPSLRMIIENTDYVYQGRLLQYQKCSIDKLNKGKRTYFEGVIRIGA